MRTANLAIVFTDIQGFTERTSQQTLEQNQRLLKVHADLLEPLFHAFGGKIIKSIGDAFLVTYESPTQAVLSGVAIQDRLWEHNRAAPEAERLDVRVAINVGEVRVEAHDVFGEPVNIAARVEGITSAGDVCFTEAVYLAMNKAEVPSQEVGLFELKGIPGKIRIFRVPKGPYRVEAPIAASTGEADAAQPPYGNLGLSKVQERHRRFGTTGERAGIASDLGTKAVALGSTLAGKTGAALSEVSRRSRVPKRTLVVGVAAAVALGAALLLFAGSPIESAIDEVEGAPQGEKDARAATAQKLIAEMKDPSEASYYQGRLDEALGSAGRAIWGYRAAARAGHRKAQKQLISLLGHPDCRVRAAAADVLGDLKLARAKGRLEDLAEEGGPGEDDTPLFGCSSRRAAKEALRKLE